MLSFFSKASAISAGLSSELDSTAVCIIEPALLRSNINMDNSARHVEISLKLIRNTIINYVCTDTLPLKLNQNEAAHSSSFLLTDKQKKKKLVSALFAFPFPFGFVGAHRVMLGTKPWIPIAYVATFGGCFGLLPLIDFFVIICSKDIEHYENNPNLFMWIK